MLWLGITSFKKNLKKYSFGMFALAMAVIVASLGLSGLDLMLSFARYPVTQMLGGDFMICSDAIELQATRNGVSFIDDLKLLDFADVRSSILHVLPHAEVTGSLAVPVAIAYSGRQLMTRMILGRSGGLEYWDMLPKITVGDQLSTQNYSEDVVLISSPDSRQLRLLAGEPLSLYVASRSKDATTDGWQLAGAPITTLHLLGTFGAPSSDGFLWSHLGVVQRLSGEMRVSWVGLRVPGLITEADQQDLKDKISSIPGLKAISSNEFSEIMIADFARLRTAARYYTPLILLISSQVVIATALAVVLSRRRELILLRIIGVSFRQIFLVFVLECASSSFVACAIGLSASRILANTLFGFSHVSLLPSICAMLITICCASLIGWVMLPKGLPQVIRNG